MDSIFSEMEKLLVSDRDDCNIQDIIGESAGKNIDDLLTEADKIIGETLPYFQTTSIANMIKTSKDLKSIQTQPKIQRNDTKKVIFNLKNNSESILIIPEKRPKPSEIYGKSTTVKYVKDEERKNQNVCSSSLKRRTAELKIPDPEVNFMKSQFQESSSLLENHNRLQIMCNRHDNLTNSMKTHDQINKLKAEEELNYYKLRNNELEKNLLFKEQEIHNLENRYQQLNHYCESFLKKNIQESLKNYDCQLNELIERNMTRESELHTIIGNLLEEIDQSHKQYRIKLAEKNKQIRKYLDQIEMILDNVYKFKNSNIKR